MTQHDVLPVLRTLVGYAGAALALIALGKAFGFSVQIGLDTQTTALVAIACNTLRV